MNTKSIIYKFVAVLNKKILAGTAMNALAHMSAGLAGSFDNLDPVRFDDYFDKDGGKHPSISDNPFIIPKSDPRNGV